MLDTSRLLPITVRRRRGAPRVRRTPKAMRAMATPLIRRSPRSSPIDALHLSLYFFFFLMNRRPPRSPLFPYTPLFRSVPARARKAGDQPLPYRVAMGYDEGDGIGSLLGGSAP